MHTDQTENDSNKNYVDHKEVLWYAVLIFLWCTVFENSDDAVFELHIKLGFLWSQMEFA
jgi:hypothetical protein